MLNKLLKVNYIFLIFIAQYVNSQEKIDPTKQEKFYNKYQEYILNHTKGLEVGNEMINLSQIPYETSIAYFTIGNTYLENGDFVQSVKYLQKSYDYASSVDSIEMQLDVLSYLIPAYRRAGLIYQSDENLKLLKKVAQKSPEYEKKLFVIFAEAKIADIDEDYCKSTQLREEFLRILKPVSPKRELNLLYEFSVLNQLCYVQYKCGVIDKANHTLDRIEKIYSEIDKNNTIKLLEFYYMNKALLYLDKGNKVEAKKYFTLATNQAIKSSSKIVIRDIIKERLHADLDDLDEKFRLNNVLNDILSQQTKVTQNLVHKETENFVSEIKQKENKTNQALVLCSLLILAIIILYFWYRKREANLKNKYFEIVENLKEHKDEVDVLNSNLVEEININNENEVELTDIIKNEQTEKNILTQLQKFESKKLYNTKGISLAQMAVHLNTNTKYLNHILKKHRDSDFYSYINDKRINNLINELHQNPNLLNYKISALAEDAGYSSHSQFASIFKEKIGMSPSKFIDFIRQNNTI